MSDDRWGWVSAPASSTPQPHADAVEQKQHFTNPPVAGAGHDALDLWAPAASEPAATERQPVEDLAYSQVESTADGAVAVGGHGPGDDAPTAQWPTPAEQNWTEQWSPADTDDLDQLVVDGRAKRARTRSLRRAGIVAGFLAVISAVVVVALIEILPGDQSSPPAAAEHAGSAPVGWCATGTNGSTTTVSTGGDQKTPNGAVTAFISALVDTRSAAAARAAMSPVAPAPTLTQLQQWITALPASTNGWCAQITTTTDSAARVLVNLHLHSGAAAIPVAQQSTFYVSATSPTAWAIDAIVSDEGSQP